MAEPDGIGPGGTRKTRDDSGGEGRDGVMQRVRVGITGLAAVFLLTVLAASLFSLLGQDDRGATRLANGAVVTNGAADQMPREPLAELGVVPGNLPAGNSAAASPASKHGAPPVQPRPLQNVAPPAVADQAPKLPASHH